VHFAFYVKGGLALKRGRTAEASDTFREMLERVAKESPDWLARAHYGLARVALASDDYDAARLHGQKSLALFGQTGSYLASEVQRLLERLPSKEGEPPSHAHPLTQPLTGEG
jgi:tetratricopeptide (TPR) repeat protein